MTVEEPTAAARKDSSPGAAFEAFLRALHPERDRAAEQYEEVRQRLRRFFRWRGARWPDELTDETIDRVGRRLAEGQALRADDLRRYLLGVARNVLRECWQRERQRGTEQNMDGLAELIPAPAAAPPAAVEARFECLERCMAALGADSRELLRRYYEPEARGRIEDRRALAAQLGLSAGTLRIRLHRLRARLAACVRQCMADRETSSAGASSSSEEGRE